MEATKIGKIYKLQCPDGHYYYGSTTYKYLCQRLSHHKIDAEKPAYRKTKLYNHIKSIGWDAIKMMLIEEVPYTCRDALRTKENEYVLQGYGDPKCLNHNRPIITEEQRKEYKRMILDKEKEWRNTVVHCDTCHKDITQGRLNQHNRSQIHLYNVEQQTLT
jgi:predicted GIY-YIG superfamily endonuclease